MVVVHECERILHVIRDEDARAAAESIRETCLAHDR